MSIRVISFVIIRHGTRYRFTIFCVFDISNITEAIITLKRSAKKYVGDGCWTHIQKYYDVSDLFKCNQHAEDVIKEYIYKEYREYVSRTMAIFHKNYNTDAHIAGYQVKMI